MKKIIAIAAAVAAAISLTCCQPNIHPEENTDTTERISPDGSATTITFVAENNWSVVNNNTWISVRPAAGLAGTNTVKVTFAANTSMEERKGAIYILDGSNTSMYKFAQNCSDILTTDSRQYRVAESGSFKIRVNSSVDYTVSTSTDWIVLPEQTNYNAATTEQVLVFGLKDNTASTERKGVVSFSAANGINVEVNVIQAGHVTIDWAKTFYKQILTYRFTGDWCGYCPNAAYDIQKFNTEEPGRMNTLSFYDGSSDAKLSYDKCSTFEKRFSVQGKPTIVIDEVGYAWGETSPGFYNIIKGVRNEQIENHPASTAITARADMEEGKVAVQASVYAKEAGDYHIHAALLESGIVVAQHDYDTGLYSKEELENFVHNDVVRYYATPIPEGEAFKAENNSMVPFNFTIDIPSKVLNRNKLSVAVYVTKAVTKGPATVSKFTYYTNKAESVDNSIIVPVGSVIGLKYE